jgi:hypothetical protein
MWFAFDVQNVEEIAVDGDADWALPVGTEGSLVIA